MRAATPTLHVIIPTVWTCTKPHVKCGCVGFYLHLRYHHPKVRADPIPAESQAVQENNVPVLCQLQEQSLALSDIRIVESYLVC